MKLGASKPWQDAMEAMTGQRDVLATPLLNYFEPLRVWLEAKNAENGDYIGWDVPTSMTKEPVINRAKAITNLVKPSPKKINKETGKVLNARAFVDALHSLRKIRL